ncbi:trithorax group protein osa-like [Helianthus annuus]|uniref:trithorax group protein osa-like n=1 Tax=Helianthus annuus TaxID=4232 RepID=UPI000B8FEB38|nr:trithorax group protein osa-like [Helianthus annuus]
MDVDDDPNPEMSPSGTPTHPIEISSRSSFHGSPYKGPDIWAERWASYKWEYTPPHRNSPPHQQVPSEDPYFQRSHHRHRHHQRQSSHRLPNHRGDEELHGCPCVGVSISAPPQHSSNSNYPSLYEDPQMGGPSNAVSEVDSALVAPAPPMGYENPIPSYPGAAGYNPFEQQAYSGYNYNNAPAVDPYIETANYNALYPGPFPPMYPTGYPAYGYQYPSPRQPQQQQPPQLPQIQPPQQQKIL